ncbi:MAG: molybdopterin converting factor subunit 1 [Aliidongia sp.]
MKLIYFAWLRDRIGLAEERVELPCDVRKVGDLLAWLKTRSPGHAEALADLTIVKVAVNQEYASPDQILAPGDEVALFPPVTGG